MAPAYAVADVGRHADLGRVRGPVRAYRRARHHAFVGDRRLDRHLRASWRRQQRLFELGLRDGRAGLYRGYAGHHERLDRMSGCRGRDRDRLSLLRFPAPAWRFAPPATRLWLPAPPESISSASGWSPLSFSAFVIGLAGAFYAHFLSIVNPGSFYLRTTFITLSMLVVGGMYSLSGAVAGVVRDFRTDRDVSQPGKGRQPRRSDHCAPERRSGDRHRHHHNRHPDVLANRPHRQPGVLLATMATRAAVAATCADGFEGIELKSDQQDGGVVKCVS